MSCESFKLKSGATFIAESEWFHNDGERFTFDVSLYPETFDDWDTPRCTGKVTPSAVMRAFNATDTIGTQEEAKTIADFLCKRMDDTQPTISAHEAYYGI